MDKNITNMLKVIDLNLDDNQMSWKINTPC